MRSFRRSIKAVSPVIATIIIVAIAIVMAIAVAYWMLGLGSSFTKNERLEFVSAYPDLVGNNFVINIDFKNTGSAACTVDNSTIFYNGKPATASAYASAIPSCILNGTNFATMTLNPGESATAVITMPKGSVWTSGMNLEVMIQTTAGKQYPKVINLP